MELCGDLIAHCHILNTHSRPVSKHRLISISKTCFSLKIDILIHNWTSKKICSIRYTQYLYFLFWKSRKWLYLRPQNGTRSLSPKAADFFGRFLFVFCTIISWTSKIQNIDIEYIQWNIFFPTSNYVFKYKCLMNFPNSRPKNIFQSST